MYVLLVEDDELVAASIASALRAQGWRLDVSDRGEPVPRSVAQFDYDAMVLDIGLPGIDGLETLRQVRAQGSTLPVLMLTARDRLEDRILGLDEGADDYLVKPFAPTELVARLRALTRRHENRKAGHMALGALRLDPRGTQAWVKEQPVALSAREGSVLQYLLLRAGTIVPREQLVALVPGWSAGTSDNALELLISRLRAKLDGAGVQLRTVRGLGYVLKADTDT